tara:strand:- start:42 stop:548 length:507 start_codon:yes stop_codon:yes gene_type:complete
MNNMKHKLNLEKVADGLGLSLNETKSFFNDGRIIGRLGEFIYAKNTNSKRAASEGSSYDIDKSDGKKVEVRSITKQISFASSKEVGYGRQVTEQGFSDKLNSLDYFVGIDFRNIENLKFIEVTKPMISEMIIKGIVRKNKSVNSNKFYNFIENKDNHPDFNRYLKNIK